MGIFDFRMKLPRESLTDFALIPNMFDSPISGVA